MLNAMNVASSGLMRWKFQAPKCTWNTRQVKCQIKSRFYLGNEMLRHLKKRNHVRSNANINHVIQQPIFRFFLFTNVQCSPPQDGQNRLNFAFKDNIPTLAVEPLLTAFFGAFANVHASEGAGLCTSAALRAVKIETVHRIILPSLS